MHHALHIQEILLHIFSYCYTHIPLDTSGFPERHHSYANARLVALARTCRTFKEPALDMIWSELNDLTPLVRCLPTTYVLRGYSFQKSLRQRDWAIILSYAHRVRGIYRLYSSSNLTEECIKALSNPPRSVEPMFPNLRVIGLQRPSKAIVPFVRHLINPKLTTILLERTEDLGSIVEAFGAMCPVVTSFHVAHWVQPDTLSGLICYWQNLISVGCRNVELNTNALLHLSRLPNLRRMALKVHSAAIDQLCATESSTSALTFPALCDLSLTSTSLIEIQRFLRSFRFPMVHHLYIGPESCPTPSHLVSTFMVLQDVCTPNSLLTLYFSSTSNQSNDPPLGDTLPYYITFDRLRPLTAFVNIKFIRLDIHYCVDLNEGGLLCLASSWPHLERFEVARDCNWTASSGITPNGFLQLIERCRSLRVLCITFDLRGYTEIPQGHPWRGLTMPNNAFVHALHSTLEEESIEALGTFFHAAPYPDFSLTTHWDLRYFRDSRPTPELRDLYLDRWRRVESLARDLWKERKELRRSLEDRSSSCHQMQNLHL